MDQFFMELREIQKKERANSSLARIRSDFYKRTYKYLDKLKTNVENNPFSNEHFLLKDIQRIATEICERREHKIADAAVMNIQRSYHLFKGKAKFDFQDTAPLNLTKEEEKLYFYLIDTLKNHRQGISLDKISENLENDSVKIKSKLKNVYDDNSSDTDVSKEGIVDNESDNSLTNDKVLKRLNEIKKAKVIKDENYEHIDGQINKPLKTPQGVGSQSKDLKEKTDDKKVKPSKTDVEGKKTKKTEKNPDIDNILKNEDEQFVELEEENLNEEIDFNEQSFSKDKKVVNETVLIFSEFGAIVGVDEKVYGPFYPQDIVVMPNENANIIIKNKKGRLIKI